MKNNPNLLAFLLLVFLAFSSPLDYCIAQEGLNNEGKLEIPEDALNFIVFGDWGRFGDDHQKEVSNQMAKTAKANDVRFFIVTGDNFYPKGVASIHDPHWKYSLEDIYTDFALQREWFVVLGNHDYMGDPDAQIAYSDISRRWVMPSRYYSKEFNLSDGSGKSIKFAMIDTNPLIPEFYSNLEYGPNVRGQDTTAQKAWLAKELAEDQEKVEWKIVVGHHPMYTGSDKRQEGYDTRRIRRCLDEMLVENEVDVYLAGHDHSLQHLIPHQGVHHFISGSASEKTQAGMVPISEFSASAYGFMLLSVNQEKILVHVLDENGQVLYKTEITK
ncbi:metallophosphoesterase [Echinicola jeungdonensis]|uniref:Metallophosphoesterase n=1 Tax=Echinicola jeungdonensis TaxID=709343 RepID=A0ABV5J9M1_9BACT|nr:metallophosphoesterase [Echinicola jeungdonensis]MDN3670375.1 metallophosphoesterase [Echinicola jeungdonensis]